LDLLARAARHRAALPLLFGAALSLSSTGRYSNGLGEGNEVAPSLQVWAGVLLGTLVYATAVAVLWWLLARLQERHAVVLLVAFVVLAVGAFLVVYPRYGEPANSADGYGDADDALNILADSVTEGFDPYERTTYEGNELSPLPGAGVLAVPLRELAGSAAYQNPLVLILGAGVLWRRWGARVTLGIVAPSMASLGVAEHFLLGGDYFTSGALVALTAYGFLWAVRRGGGWPWALALALGLVTANRTTTVVVLALVGVVLFASREVLLRWVPPLALAVVVNLALWVPWSLHRGDDGFPPLDRVDLLGPSWVAYLALLLLVAALAWIAAGRWRRPDAGSAAERLAGEGPVLAVGGAPSIVWSPTELYRITSYLWFAVPVLADHLAQRLTANPFDPS
jgi:hypothetical protein